MSMINRVRVERVEGTLMAVNSYIVEGPDGLVVIDGQLTVSDARAVRRALDASGRPVAGLIVTHGHPDHYAGAATILDGLSVPIVSTAGVAEVISRDDSEKDGIVGPMMGTEWPTSRRFVEEVVAGGSTVRLGGLEFTVQDLGSGESGADTLWSLDEDTLFSGDVAYNDMHAYLLDGHFDDWLQLLARLEGAVGPRAVLHVGHGNPADKSVLARQANYVRAFVEVVSSNLERSSDERHDEVVAAMRELVSNDDLLFLLELSIEPAVAVLKGRA